MEAIKTRLKTIAWFLTALMLMQSCVVYHKTPTNLEQASREQTKTKITNTNEDIFKYEYVTFEDGIYYGISKKSGEIVKTPLNQEYIDSIVTKNQKSSTWATVVIIAVPIIALVVMAISVRNSLEGLSFDLSE